MKPIILRSIQRMAIASTAFMLLALMLAFWINGLAGLAYLFGVFCGALMGSAVQWLGFHDGWFR